MPSDDPIAIALKDLRKPIELYRRYYRYYDGRQNLRFATEKYNNAFAGLFREFALNLCPAVVDAMADRLTVTGFESEDAEDENDPVATAAWDIWRANRMDRHAGEVHREALLSGDAYVIVWPDEQMQPRFYAQKGAGVTVHYAEESDDPEDIDWAAKMWVLDNGQARLNLYYPDRIEKYITTSSMSGGGWPEKASAFREHLVEGETWPLDNPYGRTPVFHFANNAGTAEFGRSELLNVLPVQDALNKSVTDLMVASEFAAFRQRWATGIDLPIDPITGKVSEAFKAGVDRLWTTGEPDAKFGEFGAADLTKIREVSDAFKIDIATITGIPLHYFNVVNGEFPSGESLKTAESRLIRRVEDRQTAFGNVWEDAMAFAMTIQGSEPSSRLSTIWESASPRSDKETWEVAALKQAAGVSRSQILREGGYSAEEVKEMLAEQQAEEDAQAEREAQMFDRGRMGIASGA